MRFAILQHDAALEDALYSGHRVAAPEAIRLTIRHEDRLVGLFADGKHGRVHEARLPQTAVALEALVKEARRVTQHPDELEQVVAAWHRIEGRGSRRAGKGR